MGMFGSKEEKIRCFEENVSSQGGSICEYFGDFGKDLSGIDFQINIFLKEHPNYKITTMTSAIGPLGASVLCVFERKDIERGLTKAPFFMRKYSPRRLRAIQRVFVQCVYF